MSILSELDVVNDCLGTLGELPINSLDDDHSLVSAARRAFKTINVREQSKQWWYNTELVVLVTDADSYVWTPADVIRCTPTSPHMPFIQRGRRLYDPTSGTYKITFAQVPCMITRNVVYEDLPPSAQIVISVATQLKFMQAYDADSTKYRQLVSEYQEAYGNMNAEHIRNTNANMIEKNTTLATLRRVSGRGLNRLATPGYLPN